MSHEILPPPPDPFAADAARQRTRTLVWLILAGVVVAGGFGWQAWTRRNAWRERVTVASHRFTLGGSDTSSRDAFEKLDSPEVWFRVVLHGVPVGAEIPLACRWLDPAGNEVHRNSWTTKPISHDDWETHCRHTVLRDAPGGAGTWTVEMTFADGRPIDRADFLVR